MERLAFLVLVLLGLFMLGKPLASEVAAKASPAERPLIVAADQGEVRVWRPLKSESQTEQNIDKITHFTIKIDSVHGASPDFWFGTETLPAGAGIPYHRHLHEDEVLYIVSGSAHVHVGSMEGDAHRGAMVFIPRDTWVSVQPIGKAPVSLVFAFNAPGFDRYMRCESAPVGAPSKLVSDAEDERCTKLGDVQYR